MEQLLTSLPRKTHEEIKRLADYHGISKSSVIRAFVFECLRWEVLYPETGIETGMLGKRHNKEDGMKNEKDKEKERM